jgi:hypothetical protein
MKSFLRFATLVESATFCTTTRSLSVGAAHKAKEKQKSCRCETRLDYLISKTYQISLRNHELSLLRFAFANATNHLR